MKDKLPGLLAGFLLILLGCLIILNNFYYLDFREDHFVAFAFAGLGLIFIISYFQDTKKIWAIITGGILLFIGIAVFIEETTYLHEDIIGAVFLFLLGCVFLVIYIKNRKNWWPVIPTGVLFSLALMVGINTYCYRWENVTPSILFIGTGLSFGFLYLIRNAENKLDWAKLPAMILIGFGTFLAGINYVERREDLFFPALLLIVGIAMIYHYFKKGKKSDDGMPPFNGTDNKDNFPTNTGI